MRCDKHRKDFVGPCNWCGKQLCVFCTARTDGKKRYCSKCWTMVGSVPRGPSRRLVTAPASGNRFVLRDGRLVSEGRR